MASNVTDIDQNLEALEKRAADFEQRVAVLEAAALKKPTAPGSSTPAFQAQYLDELLRVRATIAAALEEAKRVEAANAELQSENTALRKTNEKQTYRSKILKASVEKLLSKNEAVATLPTPLKGPR